LPLPPEYPSVPISKHAPTKEGLLVDPVRDAIAEIVGSYSARPPDESAVEALIQAFVTRARDADELDNLDIWRHAIATAPHLLSKTVLVSETDHDKFIEQVASRMRRPDSRRPARIVGSHQLGHSQIHSRSLADHGYLREPTIQCPTGRRAAHHARRVRLRAERFAKRPHGTQRRPSETAVTLLAAS
jgi:hypothetical protein